MTTDQINELKEARTQYQRYYSDSDAHDLACLVSSDLINAAEENVRLKSRILELTKEND